MSNQTIYSLAEHPFPKQTASIRAAFENNVEQMSSAAAFMSIEEAKLLIELRDFDEIAEYLKLGWLLTGHLLINLGEDGLPNETARHILAWRKDGRPQRPEKEFAPVLTRGFGEYQ